MCRRPRARAAVARAEADSCLAARPPHAQRQSHARPHSEARPGFSARMLPQGGPSSGWGLSESPLPSVPARRVAQRREHSAPGPTRPRAQARTRSKLCSSRRCGLRGQPLGRRAQEWLKKRGWAGLAATLPPLPPGLGRLSRSDVGRGRRRGGEGRPGPRARWAGGGAIRDRPHLCPASQDCDSVFPALKQRACGVVGCKTDSGPPASALLKLRLRATEAWTGTRRSGRWAAGRSPPCTMSARWPRATTSS